MCGNYPTPFPRPTTPFSATPSPSKAAFLPKWGDLPKTAQPADDLPKGPSGANCRIDALRRSAAPAIAPVTLPPFARDLRPALRIDAVPTQKSGNPAAAAAKIVKAYLNRRPRSAPRPKDRPQTQKDRSPLFEGRRPCVFFFPCFSYCLLLPCLSYALYCLLLYYSVLCSIYPAPVRRKDYQEK